MCWPRCRKVFWYSGNIPLLPPRLNLGSKEKYILALFVEVTAIILMLKAPFIPRIHFSEQKYQHSTESLPQAPVQRHKLWSLKVPLDIDQRNFYYPERLALLCSKSVLHLYSGFHLVLFVQWRKSLSARSSTLPHVTQIQICFVNTYLAKKTLIFDGRIWIPFSLT